MKERSFDEMIAYFNRRVSKMDIAQDYKMELLGMVTALGYKHEKSAQRWIPCSERMPKPKEYAYGVLKYYLVQNEFGDMMVCSWDGKYWSQMYQYKKIQDKAVAWMPLPEPWEGEQP